MQRVDQPQEFSGSRPSQTGNSGRNTIAFLLIIAGVLWLTRRLDLISFPDWLFQWPMILILVGAVVLINNKFRSVGGYILLLLGAYFFADHNFDFPHALSYYFWPTFLITVGLFMLLRPRRSKRFDDWRAEHNDDHTTFMDSKETRDTAQVLKETVILGGVKKYFISKDFKGGKLTCIMGGADLYLGDCELLGDATINVQCVMGGTSLSIPRHWKVRATAQTFLGGIEDGRRLSEISDSSPTLTIEGSIVLGGLEIKSA